MDSFSYGFSSKLTGVAPLSRGMGEGARAIFESFLQLLFALTVPLAGWPESRVPSQGWLLPRGLEVPPSLAVPRGAEGPHLVLGAGGGGGELCETGLPFDNAYDPLVF